MRATNKGLAFKINCPKNKKGMEAKVKKTFEIGPNRATDEDAKA